MELSRKLQIKAGQRLATLGGPVEGAPVSVEGCELADSPEAADVVLAFVRRRADLDTVAAPAVSAALADKLAWIAYPKAGKLDTDLNRDVLRDLLTARGVQPVRQVAVDDVWSALRFRPA
jgi:hypothetical protein